LKSSTSRSLAIPALLCQVPDNSEVVRSLCVNINRHCDSLSDCKSDKDMYHSVFTRSDHHLGCITARSSRFFSLL